MNIDAPSSAHIPQLRSLWKEAFGDTDEFLDIFERTAFSADRCRCVTENGDVVAALYFFNCSYSGERIAYLYAVATAKKYRGRGICRALMEDTHQHLEMLGYRAAILVPGSKELFDFYRKMGYEICSHIGEIRCFAADNGTTVRQIDSSEYAKLRRQFLPKNGVVQEEANLEFLKEQAAFYTGDRFLLAARSGKDTVYGLELLGDNDIAPEIVHSLGYSKGVFRVPEGDKPFAMYYPLGDENIVPPSYFGLAFD